MKSFRRDIERKEKWEECIDQIPSINFPAEWSVKIIPPYAGVMVRFIINNKISVYLDFYDILGFVGKPYWEISSCQTDTFQILLSETDKLIPAISEALRCCEV